MRILHEARADLAEGFLSRLSRTPTKPDRVTRAKGRKR